MLINVIHMPSVAQNGAIYPLPWYYSCLCFVFSGIPLPTMLQFKQIKMTLMLHILVLTPKILKAAGMMILRLFLFSMDENLLYTGLLETPPIYHLDRTIQTLTLTFQLSLRSPVLHSPKVWDYLYICIMFHFRLWSDDPWLLIITSNMQQQMMIPCQQ